MTTLAFNMDYLPYKVSILTCYIDSILTSIKCKIANV
nr:MAG TPA: hypothetical protein [Caudoviricetes sp.]DAT36346.1 MAG TPA: hypothetical protein [Caudoviricetes sp.]